jgi:hypothetical protein
VSPASSAVAAIIRREGAKACRLLEDRSVYVPDLGLIRGYVRVDVAGFRKSRAGLLSSPMSAVSDARKNNR